MSSTQRRRAADARDRLIESHLPLVRALARRYAGPGAELEDLVQVGSVALVRASDRFDPGKGVAFATFATPRIEGEIRHHLRDRSTPLRIPRPLQELSQEIRRRQGELTTRLGRAPTVSEVAEAVKADPGVVEQALAADEAREAVPLHPDDDRTSAPAGETAAGDSDDRLIIAAAVRELDERERRIIYLRFHADQTERQIAQELGISQAQVSRLLSAALTQLRHSLQSGDGAQGDIATDTAISRPSSALAAEPGAPERTAGSRPPKPTTSYSGRFLLRMPSALHEQLARSAEREQVSLNRFVTDTLAARVSPTPNADPGPAEDHAPAPSDLPAQTPRRSARAIRLMLAANVIVMVVAAAVAVTLLVLALQRGI